MKIYLAGPMRNIPQFNFPAFMKAAMRLRDMGHFVFNPAERDLAEGFNSSLPLDHPDNLETFDLSKAFAWDFATIMKVDAIVLLPGWEASKGVQAELVLAKALLREVFLWDTANEDLVLIDIESYTVSFQLANDKAPV